MNKILLGVISVILIFVFLIAAYKFTNTASDKIYPQVNSITKTDHLKWATDSASKKNILVEYSDLQCPACKTFHDFIKSEIEASGSANAGIMKKVTFVYRHFPLAQHQHEEGAAYAAEAAGKQDKFFEFSNLLFAKQKEWSDNDGAVKKFESYAKELGLDLE